MTATLQITEHWYLSHRADGDVLPLANRHYNRQSPDSKNFIPPGSCLVLKTRGFDAVWATSFPKQEYVKHAWAGALINTLFRNESGVLSSGLITEALAATQVYYKIPVLGMITFIDPRFVRRKRDYGRCYRKAGFQKAVCPQHTTKDESCASCWGFTKGLKITLQLPANCFPDFRNYVKL